ncbi:glycosyltransferase family 4 protein [Planctomycetota bacterium]
MKTAYIVPGTGGTFYCQNCVRDISLLRELARLDHDVIAVPMYLPPQIGGQHIETDAPIFYGAVSLYLEHRMPWLRIFPRFMRRLLDLPAMLRYAARKSGTVRAHGLEDMTISMLKGENGEQAAELERLVAWLKREGDIDLVHISNALLLGLIDRIKDELKVPIICSLQDEEQWIDSMDDPFRSQVWDIIREKVSKVDAFIAVSDYYAALMQNRLAIPAAKMHTVPLGISPDRSTENARPFNPPVIGYLARLSRNQGLDQLLDAFILLKKKKGFEKVRLHVTGGQTGDDVEFIAQVEKRIRSAGLEQDIEFFSKFGEKDRDLFLQDLTVMCVPSLEGEAFGLFQIEAMAAGVPAVQPAAGAYPEIIANTGGGITYPPDGPEALADTLADLLSDPERVAALGRAGRQAVSEKYTLKQMAENTAAVYRKVIDQGNEE